MKSFTAATRGDTLTSRDVAEIIEKEKSLEVAAAVYDLDLDLGMTSSRQDRNSFTREGTASVNPSEPCTAVNSINRPQQDSNVTFALRFDAFTPVRMAYPKN